MIFKADLIDAINGLSHDLVSLSLKVNDIEKNIKKTERRLQNLEDFMDTQTRINNNFMADSFNKKYDEAKEKVVKSVSAKKQPRTKDGKFAKKK